MKFKHSINGMSCLHCENNVKKTLKQLPVSDLNVSYQSGTIEYTHTVNQMAHIKTLLNDSEYSVHRYKKPWMTYISYAFIILVFIWLTRVAYNQFDVIKLNSSTAYFSVLLFGLVTSLHCVGMCGGIALSQTNFVTPKNNLINTLQYNLGRILTYSLIGGVLGLIGSQIALSDGFKTAMFFIIGSIMLLLGLNNLGVIQFRLIKIGFGNIKFLEGKTPFVVGIMNGFMPCAPLQTMQLLALTSSSFLSGFLVMLIFGIGTMPLLFIFSNMGLFIKKSHHKHISRVSAIVVILMSVMIFQQGFSSMGITLAEASNDDFPFAKIEDGYQIVNIYVDPYYETEEVKVKKDMPVKLMIHVLSVSGCTANIMVPKYDVNTDLQKGETQELIFTPTQAENLKITCWMSMVNTFLEVVE